MGVIADGRTARAERTREALVDALLRLLQAGHLRPTTAEIAAQAGVSARSVHQHFPDRDGLFTAVALRQRDRVIATLGPPIDDDGPLEDRILRLTARRAQIHELVTPVRRAAQLIAHEQPRVAAEMSAFRAVRRELALRCFALELQAMRRGRRDAATAALVAALSWSTWEQLRAHQDLDEAAALAAVRTLVRGALA